MKKLTLKTLLFTAALCAVCPGIAQDRLEETLPLLQKETRSYQETNEVLALFRTSKKPAEIFAAGASLVKLPPVPEQQTALYTLIMRDGDILKKVFSAIILTAMGNSHEEFIPLLTQAAQSQDNALRSYAAAAYTILNPQDTQYAPLVINLYIYDENFAQRAMNLISATDKETLKYLKSALQDQDPKIRAAAVVWLGDMQTASAAKTLLKEAKKEQQEEVISALATALAKNQEYTLKDCLKNLRLDHNIPQSNTYALALGFMTGNAVDGLKKALNDKNQEVRINAARAAAYMARVLTDEQSGEYSMDLEFDKNLLKTLVPQLAIMAKKEAPAVKVYANNAIYQIAKL